MTKEYVI